MPEPPPNVVDRREILKDLQRTFATFFARPKRIGAKAPEPDRRPGLLFASIEGWPSFVDLAGPSAADAVSRSLAAAVTAALPPGARVGWFDWASLLVLLADTDAASAEAVAHAVASATVEIPVRLTVGGTLFDGADGTWRHATTHLAHAVDRGRASGGPSFVRADVGPRAPTLSWRSESGATFALAPRDAFGPNLSEQWLPLGEIERRVLRLGAETVELRFQRYELADELAWALVVGPDASPFTMSEERSETSSGNLGAITSTVRTESTRILFGTVLHDLFDGLRPERQGDDWILDSRTAEGGAIYNTYVYTSVKQKLRLDLARRHAHVTTSRYVDTST